eukprot:SAG31_NODE_2417_length_5729_cov_2.939432_2_plen_94_part_00
MSKYSNIKGAQVVRLNTSVATSVYKKGHMTLKHAHALGVINGINLAVVGTSSIKIGCTAVIARYRYWVLECPYLVLNLVLGPSWPVTGIASEL